MSWGTAIRNLEFVQGQTYEKEWAFAQNGSPINLTGFSGQAQIRDSNGTLLADLSTTNGGIMITGAQGKVKLILTPATTGSIPPTDDKLHYWDIELTSGSRVEKPLRGLVIVHKRATGASS